MSDALVEVITRYTNAQDGESPFQTAIEGLTILRSDHETRPSHLIFKPALCVVAQGAKWSMFGNRRIDYRPGQALIVNVEMPVFSRGCRGEPERALSRRRHRV